jgi:hypothetical protein
MYLEILRGLSLLQVRKLDSLRKFDLSRRTFP